MKKFEKFGTVQNLNKKSKDRASHSGRKRLRDEALIKRVKDVEFSKKKQSKEVPIPRNSKDYTP